MPLNALNGEAATAATATPVTATTTAVSSRRSRVAQAHRAAGVGKPSGLARSGVAAGLGISTPGARRPVFQFTGLAPASLEPEARGQCSRQRLERNQRLHGA